MKKIILCATVILLAQTLKAQSEWTSSGTTIYNNNTGNVGIGTTTPATKLHVENGVVTISGNNSYGGPQLVLGPAPSNNNSWGIESSTTGLNFWRLYSGQPNPGNNFLFLKHSDGNVGIRTDHPTAGLTVNSNVLIGDPASVPLPSGYKLYVETGILTEKVKVAVKSTGNWSDYVFDKNHKLMSLPELSVYVHTYKHLPNIPSAEEVVAEGVDIGDISSRLLGKIEELTLYIIEQDKQLRIMKAELETLKK